MLTKFVMTSLPAVDCWTVPRFAAVPPAVQRRVDGTASAELDEERNRRRPGRSVTSCKASAKSMDITVHFEACMIFAPAHEANAYGRARRRYVVVGTLIMLCFKKGQNFVFVRITLTYVNWFS